MKAGSHYELQCQVVGSKPEPTITWWKGSQSMRNTKQMVIDFNYSSSALSKPTLATRNHTLQTSGEGNVTTSILSFTPSMDDRGKYLSCRAEQSLIPDSGKEDGWTLDIYRE